MNIISKTISVINPNQTPVDTCDQPVYALTKQIQRRYPELFGNSKYFLLSGRLHIGQALLIVHGELLKVAAMINFWSKQLVNNRYGKHSCKCYRYKKV